MDNAPELTTTPPPQEKFDLKLDRPADVLRSAVQAEVNHALSSNDPEKRAAMVQNLGAALASEPESGKGDMYEFYERKRDVLAGIGSIALYSDSDKVAEVAIRQINTHLQKPDSLYSGKVSTHPFAVQLLGALAVKTNNLTIRELAFNYLRQYAEKPIVKSRAGEGNRYELITASTEAQKLANVTAETITLPPSGNAAA